MEHLPLPQRWPNVSVPPGYRFKPTPQELIQYYLEPWVATTVNNEPAGQQSPGEFYGIMAAADVYGEDPSTLASRFQHIAHDDGNWYFLSVARWKDGNRRSKRVSRSVVGGDGDGHLGTWHGSGKRISLRGGVGYRQGFEFRPADGRKITWLMEEFSTVLDDAKDDVGAKVLCRLHLTPKEAAAAVAAATVADGVDCQQQLVANDVQAAPPCNKRQRQRVAACQQVVEHHFDNAGTSNWTTTAPAEVGFSSYAIATTVAAPAPPPPDVGCFSSYAIATTSSHAVTELTAEALANWQHQPMMEQAGDESGYQYQYHCAGDGHGGGVHIRTTDEPQPLEMVTTDVGYTAQDSKMEDSDLMFTMEQLMGPVDGWIIDSNNNSSANLSFLEPRDGGVQENNDLKPETNDGVQLQENNEPKLEPSDGVQENEDDPKRRQ